MTPAQLSRLWGLPASGHGFDARVRSVLEVHRSRTGDHIAFSVSKSALLACAEKLKQMGQEFLFARSDTALYFYDYDNHVFELDTADLEKDLANEI